MSNINLFEANILFEDNHLIIINKKPGELTQGDKTKDKTLGEKVKDVLVTGSTGGVGSIAIIVPKSLLMPPCLMGSQMPP